MSDDDHDYRLSLIGLPEARILPNDQIYVAARQMQEMIVRVQANPDALRSFNTEFDFLIESISEEGNAGVRTSTESRFFGPQPLVPRR